jgi:AbrB family looped-hinge helix DNA binding protein
MPFTKISAKGQLTLPIDARKALGIKPSDRVYLSFDNTKIEIRPVEDFFELEGFLGGALTEEEEGKGMLDLVASRTKGEK